MRTRSGRVGLHIVPGQDHALWVYVLGDIRAGVYGRARAMTNERQQRILAALVLAGTAGLGVEQLVTRVWDETDEPPDPVRTLRTYVSRLRSSIAEGENALIVTRPGGYALAEETFEIDSAVFERTVAEASRELDPYIALELFDEALALWSAPAYRDLAHLDWVRPEAVRLDELRLSAEESRLRIRLDADRHADVAADAERLILDHPYREQLTAIRATALYRSGRHVEALAELEQHRDRLRDDLGVDPSPELSDLETKILNHDPDLAAANAGGRRLRGYRLGKQIGEGAYSIVYRATQPSIGREVAVKVIRKELANERDFIRRFESEAQLVARLQHPRIVPLYDFWREANNAYLVMPWLEGGSLAKRLRAGPLALEETVRVVGHVAAGLDFAHGRGVIHRDVKPSNVLVDSEGNAYIADFGIALADIPFGGNTALPVSAGSPAYAAPEQFSGPSIDARVDTYALAVMAYELLNGSLPWPESATTATLLHHHHVGLPPLQLADDRVGQAVDALLARATATNPADRPATTVEFAAELTAIISAQPFRPSAAHVVNPYRGLAAFEEPDAPYFFGREDLVVAVIEKLQTDSLALLVGPSGSGKSSLLRAGIIPLLRSAGSLPVVMNPSADPIGSLASALGSISSVAPGLIKADLDAGLPLATVVSRIVPEAQVVIAVDQMEELFTLASADDAETLLAAFASLVTAGDANLRLIGAIRADFFGHPLTSPSFGALAGPATVTIGPMRADQLAAAISEPARLSGVDVEEALVAELAAETAGRAGSLPLMQFALTRVWDERSGSTVTFSDYERLGGLTGTLVRSAETLWEGLSPSEQAGARRLLLRLVQIGDEVTRRREQVGAAVSLGVEPGLIEAFVEARLVTLDRDQTSREPTIELSHEALIDAWPRLARWVEDSRTALVTAQRLRTDASEWDFTERTPDLLYGGSRLVAARGAAADPAVALASLEEEFLAASEAAKAEADEAETTAAVEEERHRARRLLLTAVAIVAGGIGIVAIVVAFMAQQRASDQASAAGFAQLIGRAIDLQSTNTELALLLAAEAYTLDPGVDAQRALLGALQNIEGTIEVWEAPRFESSTFSECFNIVGPGQFVVQPNTFVNGTPDPGGGIVDIAVVDRTVHRLESSRLECDVYRSPRDGSDGWLYVGSDNTPTTIVLDSDGAELGAYGGFVQPFFDGDGRLLAKAGERDAVGPYVELDPMTGEILADGLFEADRATLTNGGRFLSVIYERNDGPVPDPSALLDPDTYEVVVDLSAHTGRAISGRSSADDSRFGYVSKDERLLVWETETGQLAIDLAVEGTAQSIAISPDGSKIALLIGTGTLEIRSGVDGSIQRVIEIGRASVMAMDWPHDDQIAVLRTTGEVDLIAPEGGGLYETGPPCCARNEFGFIIPDGIPNAYAVYGNRDTGVNTYLDLVTGESWEVDISEWVFAEGGADLHMARDKTTVLIRPPFEMFRIELDGTAEEPHFPFGDQFVFEDEVPDHLPVAFHGGNEYMFMKLTAGSVSPDLRQIEVEAVQIGVIDIDTMEMITGPNIVDVSEETPTPNHAELLPGGVLLVGQELEDGRFRQQYFGVDGERFLEFFLPFDIGWWLLTPDRRWLLTADAANDEIRRWDVATGESIALAVDGEPETPDILSDGRFMIQTATGQYELWDIEEAAPIGVLADVGPRAFTASAVHPDESHVWLRLDGFFTKIPLDPQRWFELACDFAGRSLSEAEWRELVSSDRPYRDVCAAA